MVGHDILAIFIAERSCCLGSDVAADQIDFSAPFWKIFAFCCCPNARCWPLPCYALFVKEDRMPITFVYAQWSIILASHANSTISLWFFHSDAFLFIIINKWWKEHHGVPAFYLFFFHCAYSWQIVIWSINRCGFPHLRKSLYNGTHSNRIRGEKRSRFEWAFPMESGTWKIWMWSQLVPPTVTHPCYYISEFNILNAEGHAK